ncbi:MAG: phosphate ABC transporter permease subunit PstC, partial [Bacilli bacterium]
MLNVNRKNNGKYIIESISKGVFLASALIAVISLVVIIGFVFYKGLTPFINKGYSFSDFFFGTKWVPSSDKYG